jgi:protein-S-isoprenylcysteine O-methyltransferase Ste14
MIERWNANQWRKAILVALAVPIFVVVLVTHSVWESDSVAHNAVEATGWFAIVICIIGRSWCALYIGGRKTSTLVRRGPYSIVRNPLYIFSIIGAAGVGFAAGSMVMGLTLGVVVFLVFHVVVMREERGLLKRLGNEYKQYFDGVPRWIPKFSIWSDIGDLNVSPKLIAATFFDATLFALAIPLLELLERLQDAGVAPVLLRLP